MGLVRMRAAAALALALAAFSFAGYAHADVNERMRSLFASVGGYGTVDVPRLMNAQNRNIFSGGGINYRAPRRTYNLLAARGPSLNAGCGGIDFYAGSFSFINKQEFVALMRNIAANSVGLAFKTALCSTSANLCQAIEDLQKTLESLNRFNIDSCETAKALVGGALGTSERSSASACLSAGRLAGLFADDSEGRAQCAEPAGFASARSAAAAGSESESQPIEFVGGNLTWQVLRKLGGGLDTADREFLMSMMGTQVVTTVSLRIQHHPPTISELSDLHERNVVLLKCDEPVSCLNVRPTAVTMSVTFVSLAHNRLAAMASRLLAGQPLTPAQIAFASGAPVPLLALVRADAAGAEGLIGIGAEAVAYAVAYRFLTDSLRQATIAASSWRSRSASEAELAQGLVDGSRAFRRALAIELHAALARLSDMLELSEQLGNTRRRLVRSRLATAAGQ